MNRRLLVAAMASALSLSSAPTVFAAPMLGHHAEAPQAAKVKTISFMIRNDSGEVMQLQAGEQQVTLGSGKTAAFKLPLGTQVISVNATAHLAAGAVVTTVSDMLKGNTLAIS